jgi:hypothetical protein
MCANGDAMRLSVLGLLLVSACATAHPRAPSPTVGVRVFSIDVPSDDSTRDDHTARTITAWLIGFMRERGIDAYLVEPDAPPYGDIRVNGSITTLDYGSEALRCTVGLGAGHNDIGIVVAVTDAAGRPLGTTQAMRGSHFCVSALHLAEKRVARDIVEDQTFLHAVQRMPAH